jgi:hypothetical protein
MEDKQEDKQKDEENKDNKSTTPLSLNEINEVIAEIRY